MQLFFRTLVLFLTGFLFQIPGAFADFDHSHDLWDRVLKSYVRGASVDYLALSRNTSDLDQYLKQLDSVARSEVDSWAREQQLAFWINVYNAFTVQVILDNYPIKSRTIKGLFVPRNSIIQISAVWKKLTWEVAGQSLTLDQIEHGLIRPNFKEPRIHFAIVCASVGCPDLRPEAFTFDKLERQLDEQTIAYLNNPSKGAVLDFEKKKICVSKLFGWFWNDFEGEAPVGFDVSHRSKKIQAALSFLSRYFTSVEARSLLQSKSADFDYLSYDWSLNDFPRPHDPAS